MGVKRTKAKPRLMPHKQVAELCGITTEALRDWVAKGNFPEPHAIIGQTWLYKADLIEHWIETAEWLPTAVWKKDCGQGLALERDRKGSANQTASGIPHPATAPATVSRSAVE